MNTVYFIVQQTMFFAIPLLIVSLGGMFSEKSGITNIALEGIMIIGAFTGVITVNLLNGLIPSQLLLLIAVLVAGLCGCLYSLLHAWASVRLKADQTISGTALNLFAPAFCIFTARALYGAKQISFVDTFHIDSIPLLGDIPVIGSLFFKNCYLTTYFGLFLMLVAHIIFKKTRFGMHLSACGEHPEAAASAGIRVAEMRYAGVAISGFLGGAGGIIFVIPTSVNFSATVAGYGFLALAVLILGRWKATGVLAASFFFGMLKALSSAYSGISFLADLPLSSEVYKMIPYLLTLFVLAASLGKSRAPKALGVIYDDGNKPYSKKGKIIAVAVSAILIAAISLNAILFPPKEQKKNAVSNGYGAEISMLIEAGASVDDKSYIQSIWEGIVHYTDKNGITRKYYQSKDTSDEALKKCIALALKGNAELIIGATNMFEKSIGEYQLLYPDKTFILFDGEPKTSAGDVFYSDNTVSLVFAEEEAGFLAGYAAVKDGNRNLGFIGGLALKSVIRFGYGFILGCEYAARELNLAPGDVKIKYTYAGTFSPNPETQAMASAWYHSGVDVIFSCAGPVVDSVIKAAENAGKYVIGVDTDQSQSSETVLTSAVKDLDYAISSLVDKYYRGELECGRQLCLSAAEGCLALPMQTSRFRSFTEADYRAIYGQLAAKAVFFPENLPELSVAGLPLEITQVEVIK